MTTTTTTTVDVVVVEVNVFSGFSAGQASKQVSAPTESETCLAPP